MINKQAAARLNEDEVIREPAISLGIPRDPSSELQVTYENEAAKRHPYNKDSDAKAVYIRGDGAVTYSF